MRTRLLLSIVIPTAALALISSHARSSDDPAERLRKRCASRLSLALTGQAASAELLAAADPQAQVDALLGSDAFVDQFARFVNSRLNDDPGEMQRDDAPFFLARYILQNRRPWHELFDGKYRVETTGTPPMTRVVDDPDGLGYFRSRGWLVRYAGNEPDGYRLNAAYRIQQNIIGLDVGAVTSAPGEDISATGRQAPACSGCHYDAYFALDKVAKVLSRRVGTGEDMTFVPPDEGPQQVLDGRMISDDRELVAALVGSTDHQFRTCRLAFEFLYGRPEATCESALFDRCVDAYTQSGDIRAALRTLAQDAGFCAVEE